MATIYTKNEPEEWPDNDPKLQAYRALQKASERMGINGYLAERKRCRMTPYEAANHKTWGVDRRSKRALIPRSIYTPTEQHEEIIEAMSQVLKGEINPEEAMALLHRGDVLNMRLGL